jgi:hypothetical protein
VCGEAGGISAAATLRAGALASGGLEWLQGDNYSLRLQLLRLKYGQDANPMDVGR